MKRKIVLALLGVMLCGACPVLGADITITVDGRELVTDTAPQQKNGRTLVPFRAIADSLGAQVQWDNAAKKVVCTKDGTRIELTVDSDIMLKNGGAVQLDTTPVISNGRVLVPVRALSEGFGARVSWYAVERQVVIRTDLKGDTQQQEVGGVQVRLENVKGTVKNKRGSVVFESDIEKPVVSGVNAEKINQSIVANLAYYFDSKCDVISAEAEMSSDMAYAQHTEIKPYSFVGKTQITCQNENYLSMLITCTVTGTKLDMGEYKTDEMLLPLTYNIKTGELVELSDFTEKTVTRGKSNVLAKIKTMDNGWYDDCAERVNNTEPKFYMTAQGVMFGYEKGCLGREKNGALFYTMDWKNVEMNK